jgi:hypothetical protein
MNILNNLIQDERSHQQKHLMFNLPLFAFANELQENRHFIAAFARIEGRKLDAVCSP